MITLPKRAEYKEKKMVFNDILDDYKEYLEITSEFCVNDRLREIHNDVISEMCGKSVVSKESLYVLTIRKLIEMINTMEETIKTDTNKELVDDYKNRYEESEKELEELKEKMNNVLNILK